MARRTTDLFDVFHRPASAATGGKRTARRKEGRGTRSAKKGDRRPFQGVFLSPRQLVLVGSACALLVVLAFVIGLGVGRHGASEGTSLSRTTRGAAEQGWFIVGGMARRDMNGVSVDAEQLRSNLEQYYGLPAANLRVRENPHDAGRWQVLLGEFRDRAQAQRYLEDHDLAGIFVMGDYPFGFAEVQEIAKR